MTRQIVCALNLLVVTAILALAGPGWAANEDATTEDVIVTHDQRQLRGHIVTETDNEIVFEVVDRRFNMRTTITILKENIVLLERGVPIPDEFLKKDTDSGSGSKPRAEKPESPSSSSADSEDKVKPARLLVIPMHGQTGTDINSHIYKEIMEDIRAAEPDAIIIDMKCTDIDDRAVPMNKREDRGYDGSTMLDDYRDLLNLFHDDLREIPQYLWVHDSVGMSSVLALSWPNMYMEPSARLGGIELAARNYLAVKGDANMFGKFREAYLGWLRGLMAYGDRDMILIDAMIEPEKKLSASFEGRNVKFSLDNEGNFIVDNSEKRVVNFDARSAENLLISEGTVDNKDDLAFLIGFREYEWIDNSKAKETIDRHREDWRRLYDRCIHELRDCFEQNLPWASGQDRIMYLGKAKGNLQLVLNAMNRFKAIEIRIGQDFGISKLWLTVQIEQINEQIRAARRAESGRRGGGGRVGGGGDG